ncbi:MAG: hypothetical protein V3W37_08620 [Candidatus Binatia bacterium]
MPPAKERKERALTQRAAELRAFLRDDPVLNELLEGKESTDGQLKTAILDSIEDWNTTQPPLAAIDIESHPSPRLMIRGAVIEILESAAIYYARNQLPYSDGGISVDDKNKLQLYQAKIASLSEGSRGYEAKKVALKKTTNIAAGFGSVPSEYSGINTDLDPSVNR